MLEIYGITMRNRECYRVAIKATKSMSDVWLERLNEISKESMTLEQALRESFYVSNDKDYLIMEVEVDLEEGTFQTVYFFDDYETLDVEFQDKEKKQLVDFVNGWKDKLPDNDKLLYGDGKWVNSLAEDIPWKKNVADIVYKI